MQQTAIDPLNIKLADLEVLEAQPKTLAIVEAAPVRPLLTRRDAKQQILGAMRMINHFSGAQMHREIDTVEFLSSRVDELEAQLQKERERFEIEKAGYRKALTAVGKVLDLYSGDPFELKAASKWTKPDMGKWMLAAAESINWVMQRAENELDHDHAVPIAKDPE